MDMIPSKNQGKDLMFIKNNLEKILSIVGNLLLGVVFVLCFLHYSGKINDGLYYAAPLLGVYTCIRAVQDWNKDRDSASLFIILAIIIFMVTFAIWLN